jgi:hypothetical protein
MFLDYFDFYLNDYLRIYNFYERRIRTKLVEKDYTFEEFKKMIDDELSADALRLVKEHKNRNFSFPNEIVPSFYYEFKSEEYFESSVPLSTYTNVYSTSIERTLVPDFGLIGYIPIDKSNISGGSPFFGCNVSLAPVNKNVPVSLSQLRFAQRTSIHIGASLNPLELKGKRDDFFDNFSLMVGGGYKAFTQSTRVLGGVVVFNKINPISAEKSIAVHPFVGLSIDIEIRKWLEKSISVFKK